MLDASTFEATETLGNGMTITIRAVRPEDKAGIADAFGRLDPDSVYTRFFQPKSALSEKELRLATEIDFQSVVALVVTTRSGGGEIIIGGGRFATFGPADQRCAEVAFLVEEAYRGLGIAGRLLGHLARIARGIGIGQFHAEVLPQNKAMLGVFARCGLPMESRQSEGVVQVTLQLEQAGPAAGA